MTSTINGAASATVETLTAEVRTLMVGNRQITLSVYRQLDREPYELIEPFGRVRDSQDHGSADRPRVHVVRSTHPNRHARPLDRIPG